jgi:hypothetical protein
MTIWEVWSTCSDLQLYVSDKLALYIFDSEDPKVLSRCSINLHQMLCQLMLWKILPRFNNNRNYWLDPVEKKKFSNSKIRDPIRNSMISVFWSTQELHLSKQMLLLFRLKCNFKKCTGQTNDNGKTKDDTKTTSLQVFRVFCEIRKFTWETN